MLALTLPSNILAFRRHVNGRYVSQQFALRPSLSLSSKAPEVSATPVIACFYSGQGMPPFARAGPGDWQPLGAGPVRLSVYSCSTAWRYSDRIGRWSGGSIAPAAGAICVPPGLATTLDAVVVENCRSLQAIRRIVSCRVHALNPAGLATCFVGHTARMLSSYSMERPTGDGLVYERPRDEAGRNPGIIDSRTVQQAETAWWIR